MSSIRSASSRTRISTWPRFATFWPTRSSSRPGRRDEDLDAAAQRLDLGVHRDPAVDHRRAQRDGPAVGPDALVDLHRELAGRDEDQDPDRVAGGREAGVRLAAQAVEDGQHEGGGLAGARSGRRRGRRGPRGRAGWPPPGRVSGSHTPPRRPCARGRPTGRVNRRSSVAPDVGPAAGTGPERDGGPTTARRWTRTGAGRPEHSRNGYDRTVTASRDAGARRSSAAPASPHRVHDYEPPERHGRERDRRPAYGTRRRRRRSASTRPACSRRSSRRSTAGWSWPSSRSTASSTSSAWPRRSAAAGRPWPTRPRPNGRPARSSAASARSALRRPLPVVVDAHAAEPRDDPRVGRPARSPGRAGAGRPGASGSAADRPRIARDQWSAAMTRTGRLRLAYWRALPGKHRRQGPTEERRPQRQKPVPRRVSRPVTPGSPRRSDPLGRVASSRAPPPADLLVTRSCRRRPYPPSPRATTRCSGGQEA